MLCRNRTIAIAMMVGILTALSLAASSPNELDTPSYGGQELARCTNGVPMDTITSASLASARFDAEVQLEESWLARHTRTCPAYVGEIRGRVRRCDYIVVENEDGAGSSIKKTNCRWLTLKVWRLAPWCH